MARAVHHTWYKVAVARPNQPALIVAAEGEHLGEAIAAAEAHEVARRTRSYAVAADLANEAPLGESLRKPHVVVIGDDTSGTVDFRWPIGVLPQLGHAITGVRGYVEHADPKQLVLEAQTDREHLEDLFLGIIERLPNADNLEIRLLDHYEDTGKTDVWLTSRVNAKMILRFLDDHDVDILHNGHVEVSVYVRAHKATLRLTEHKTVVWIAEDRALEADMTKWLKELGVPRVESLITPGQVAHFHYRPAKSRDRKKLGDQLYRQRLRVVATVGRDTEG